MLRRGSQRGSRAVGSFLIDRLLIRRYKGGVLNAAMKPYLIGGKQSPPALFRFDLFFHLLYDSLIPDILMS